MTEEQIIEGCRKFSKDAQKALYEKYVSTFRAICRRYTADTQNANDILHDCFIKIFTKFDQFTGNGSFEGWMKRIIINACISWCRDRNTGDQFLKVDEIKDDSIYEEETDTAEECNDVQSTILNANFTKEEIQQAVELLPEGYKMVFFLYVFENYKHNEIARELNIDVNTSKSQLSRARKLLQKKLMELCQTRVMVTS
jgi:RNA polymerase sigma-70 factor (ECF subfamily)